MNGQAQSWTGVPVPPDETTPSQVLVVEGSRDAFDALLVFGAHSRAAAGPRTAECCGVQFWLDGRTIVYSSSGAPDRLVGWRVGTHTLGQVATIEGYDAQRTAVVGSYARIWR